jgi:hypothetical protein
MDGHPEELQMDDTTRVADLTGLLARARRAGPGHRIEWRDPIAAHGRPAIEAIRPWLAEPRLAAFAIRVIERAGRSGEWEVAVEVLRRDRLQVDPRIRPDVDWALVTLKAAGLNGDDPAGTTARPAPARPARAARSARPAQAARSRHP